MRSRLHRFVDWLFPLTPDGRAYAAAMRTPEGEAAWYRLHVQKRGPFGRDRLTHLIALKRANRARRDR